MATRRRCSPTASASPIASSPRANRYARWALAQGVAQGRHRLPADAEPAGIPGALARRHAGRRGGGAAQHQPGRPRSRIASTSSSPRHIIVAAELLGVRHRARLHLAGNARSGCMARPTPISPRIDREVDALRRRRWRPPSAAAHHRGPRALHLHVGHHRPAQGRQHQPLPADAGEPRLCRRDGHAADDRMYDCLPLYHTAGGVVGDRRCWSTAARW